MLTGDGHKEEGLKKLFYILVTTLAVAFASAQSETLNDRDQRGQAPPVGDDQGLHQDNNFAASNSETKVEKLNDLDFDDRGETGSSQAGKSGSGSSANATAGITIGKSTRPEVEYAAKNFGGGLNSYCACYRAPNGRRKTIRFRYSTAAQKRDVKRWVSLYVDAALANPKSALGRRLNTLDTDIAQCQQVLDIDPNTGRSRRLDNLDKVLAIQPNGRSWRLDNHDTRLDNLERERDGNRFGFGWLTVWLLIITGGLILGFFLRPRN